VDTVCDMMMESRPTDADNPPVAKAKRVRQPRILQQDT
jgi:hypothetical protein